MRIAYTTSAAPAIFGTAGNRAGPSLDVMHIITTSEMPPRGESEESPAEAGQHKFRFVTLIPQRLESR